MDSQPLEDVVRIINVRLDRVDQILPTLATKEELASAIAPLATKEELASAIAPLATKEELASAIAPLATRVEMHAAIAAAVAPLATREFVHEEGVRTRQHFDAVAERLEGHIRLVAEGVVAVNERVESVRAELKADIAQLDRRVMRLEVSRR